MCGQPGTSPEGGSSKRPDEHDSTYRAFTRYATITQALEREMNAKKKRARQQQKGSREENGTGL